MKNRVALVLVVILAVAGSLFATGTKSKLMRHGRQSVGTVSTVDDSAKSFTLKNKSGDQTIYWTEGTKVKGGALKADENVTVRWMEKDGKKIATSINIAAAKKS